MVETSETGLCSLELLLTQSTFPWFQTGSAVVPDTLLEKHCKQILITLVAAQGGERHILLLGQPIFQLRSLQLPHPCTVQEVHRWPRLPPIWVCLHSKLHWEERHRPWWPSLLSRRLLPQTPLFSLKLILQLLSLAQAANDYLKSQPFIYEKCEPDIILIDCHLLNISCGRGNRNGTLCARIMELFLDV